MHPAWLRAELLYEGVDHCVSMRDKPRRRFGGVVGERGPQINHSTSIVRESAQGVPPNTLRREGNDPFLRCLSDQTTTRPHNYGGQTHNPSPHAAAP